MPKRLRKLSRPRNFKPDTSTSKHAANCLRPLVQSHSVADVGSVHRTGQRTEDVGVAGERRLSVCVADMKDASPTIRTDQFLGTMLARLKRSDMLRSRDGDSLTAVA